MHIKSHKYAKDGVTILWQPDKCIHSGVCVKGLSAVFDPAKSPWIDMGKAETARIVEQVKYCPSGALSLLNGQD
ncbi:MAG: (4Fe-4S)-binding protein [Ferruginibacter sp.]|nr:(4Fe-4S)-binding protein [Ferruginibacter sp.]